MLEEIIKIGADTAEKCLTNLLSLYLVATRILKKFLLKASKPGKQASKASIKSAENGFLFLTSGNLQAV